MHNIDGLTAHEFSLQHCNQGELDCSWYHGSWHLLKALGVVSSSAVHEQTLSKLIALSVSSMTSPRILITGSTDETLIRLVHDACQTLGIKENLTAVDICATPLAFMQAYANAQGIRLVTCRCDVLEFAAEEKFDIILTHAFMGYFDDQQRPRLLQKWCQLLSDQGKIITIQRVRPADSPALVSFSPEQTTHFVNAALAAASASDTYSQSELATIETAASEFAKNFVNHAITSKTALESLFLNAGLAFDFLEYHHLQKKGELSGPSVPSNAEFAHIIAGHSQR